MKDNISAKVLIVGAGSMGVITGYHLQLSGVDVTFLIRPHRKVAMDRPQVLYSYDDNSLKEYSGYKLITAPSDILATNHDYILITLDGAQLQSDVGLALVDTIGEAARGTDTKVILGTVRLELLPWFIKTSGLAPEQVTNGLLGIQSYPAKAVTLPVHAPTDPALVAQADLGYIHCFDYGFVVDDSAPAVANGFAELYNASGVSRCIVKPVLQYAVDLNPIFAVFLACELMGWPKFRDISKDKEIWSLAVAAVKEIQGLSVHGEPGRKATAETTEAGYAADLAAWEARTLPFDLQAFNAYHHGGKVHAADRDHLRTCVAHGEEDGQPMTALKTLLRRADDPRQAA